uniref:Reverse transcriptase domain-containing protein n=1 Tax=Tanacetum cinerariifolium TaxID=118510 RepID=A0A6L2KXX0_TANCI|nr:hypothetical protein [Tanacetum cinerariifolium]
MEKFLADQRGRNVEIYLEEIVIKRKNKMDLVQDVEETLRKLKRVNIKIDLVTSSYKLKEGRFLGYMVTKEGVKEDLEKIHAIILGPSPRSPIKVEDSKRIWLDKQGRISPPKDKKEIRQVSNIGRPKRRRRSNAMSMANKRDNKFCATGREGRNPDTCFLCEPTATRNGNMLHSNRKDGSPKERMHSYAIRLKFNTFDHDIDCEALMAGLAVSVSKEVLTRLATIKLEFLNQEVSVDIKTRPSVKGTSSSKKGKATSNVPSAKPNYNWEVSGRN